MLYEKQFKKIISEESCRISEIIEKYKLTYHDNLSDSSHIAVGSTE